MSKATLTLASGLRLELDSERDHWSQAITRPLLLDEDGDMPRAVEGLLSAAIEIRVRDDRNPLGFLFAEMLHAGSLAVFEAAFQDEGLSWIVKTFPNVVVTGVAMRVVAVDRETDEEVPLRADTDMDTIKVAEVSTIRLKSVHDAGISGFRH